MSNACPVAHVVSRLHRGLALCDCVLSAPLPPALTLLQPLASPAHPAAAHTTASLAT